MEQGKKNQNKISKSYNENQMWKIIHIWFFCLKMFDKIFGKI